MRNNLLIAGLLLTGILSGQTQKRPKLVIGVVVDQMRYDYLDRFFDDFSDTGFKRLINEGFNCKNVNYNYKPTYTGPGHATIFTGVPPSVHGIVGNYWFDRKLNKPVYCVKVDSKEGIEKNPSRLLVETFADEMKQFSNFKSKSFGISLKDRGAILPAGHLADGAYWFDDKTGEWISSSYYPKKRPQWLAKFNDQDFEKEYLAEGWGLMHEASNYSESWPDLNSFENKLSENSSTVFPYDLKSVKQEIGWAVLKRIPQGNQMSADLFMELIEGEELGKDEITDFISLSFSATDYVGHRFGVQSVEVHDTYLRLDRTIAELLSFLDKKIGEKEYVFFLTSDHGASMPLAYLEEKGLPHGKIDGKELTANLKKQMQLQFGDSSWLAKLMNLNVYFNESLKRANEQKYLEIKSFTKKWFQNQAGIVHVVENGALFKSTEERVNRTLLGIHPDRAGDLILIEEPNWVSYSEKGSTHGSAYAYDTHVPLIFFGKGIENGESSMPYSITSIVPTLSLLLNIPLNHALQTSPIEKIIR
ncbi:MAG: alkaline phosphatase family protein [Flavobacteriales bacterium]|nr:alkaline phosphatase family protein [Flavobacteriales bacterium]